MSPEQAGTLIDRLVAAFDKQLKPDTAAVYVEQLVKMPYEKTRLAVEACIEKERFFPHIATIRKYADEATFEGQPNAAAYLQDGERTPWHRKPEAAYAIWRQTQIESMDDEDRYWDYVHDPILRDAQDREWRQQWERQMRGLAAV